MNILNGREGREQFEKFYREAAGCLLPSVKEKHWKTWLAAQVALLEAHGPAVHTPLDDIAVTPGVNHD